MGLIEAILRFDFQKDNSLLSYAYWWMKSKMEKITREGRLLSSSWGREEEFKRLLSVIGEFMATYGYEPSEEELAHLLNWPLEKVRDILNSGWISVTLFDDLVRKDHSWQKEGEELIYLDNDPYERLLKQLRRREIVKEMLAKLNLREKRIIIWRFGLNGREPQTLEEIGKKLGISREMVRQLQNRILKKLEIFLKVRSITLYDLIEEG